MEDPLKTQVDEKKEQPQERKPDRVAWKLAASAICGAAIMYCFKDSPPDISLGVKPGDAYILTSAGGTNSNPWTTTPEPWLVSVFDVEEVKDGAARGRMHWMKGDGHHLQSGHDHVWSCSSLKSSFTKIE